jgi:hypothetical protein
MRDIYVNVVSRTPLTCSIDFSYKSLIYKLLQIASYYFYSPVYTFADISHGNYILHVFNKFGLMKFQLKLNLNGIVTSVSTEIEPNQTH